MQNTNSKINTVLLIVILIILVIGGYFLVVKNKNNVVTNPLPDETSTQLPVTAPHFSFQPLTTTYTSFQEFPTVTTLAGPIPCVAYTQSDEHQVSAEEQTIGGVKFCVQTTGDAAMSHEYTTKIYTTGTTQVKFIVVAVACGVYDEPKKSQCDQEKIHFSINDIILNAMK